MGEKQKYYIFAGLRPGGEVAAESGGEGDVEKLWRRLTSDVAELYGQPSEVTQSKFQLFTHFHADDFFVQIIVDWGTDDWPRDMVPASIRVDHAEDVETFAHSLYDYLDGRGYNLALEEDDAEFIRCNFTSPSDF